MKLAKAIREARDNGWDPEAVARRVLKGKNVEGHLAHDAEVLATFVLRVCSAADVKPRSVQGEGREA